MNRSNVGMSGFDTIGNADRPGRRVVFQPVKMITGHPERFACDSSASNDSFHAERVHESVISNTGALRVKAASASFGPGKENGI